MILLLQLTMLAITASTTPSTITGTSSITGSSNGTRVVVRSSSDLDRVERGMTDDGDVGGGGGRSPSHDVGYEQVIIRVGVVETIRSLWDNETPIVRRFR